MAKPKIETLEQAELKADLKEILLDQYSDIDLKVQFILERIENHPDNTTELIREIEAAKDEADSAASYAEDAASTLQHLIKRLKEN